MVEDIESGGDVQSPVTHAVNRQQLETSQDPSKNELAQIGEIVERIDFRIRRIENNNRQDVSSRRSPRSRQIMETFMELLDKVVVKDQALGVNDIAPLTHLAELTKDAELLGFVSHLEPHVAPF